jgi:folate-binding protein YgfZ
MRTVPAQHVGRTPRQRPIRQHARGRSASNSRSGRPRLSVVPELLAAPFVALVVTGPDALRWLQGQLTADIAALEPGGEGCLSALLDVEGHLVTWLRARRSDAETVVLTIASDHRDRVLQRLERFRLRMRVALTLEGTSLLVDDPGTPDPLWPLERDRSLGTDAPDVDAYRARSLALAAFDPALDLVDGLLPHGVPGLITRAVSFTKGCYTGQELVARTDARGALPPIELAVAELDSNAVPAPGTPILAEGSDAGFVVRAGIIGTTSRAVIARRRRWRARPTFELGGVPGSLLRVLDRDIPSEQTPERSTRPPTLPRTRRSLRP